MQVKNNSKVYSLPDYHVAEGEYEIAVKVLCNLLKLSDIYFIRPLNVWLLFNYLKTVGCKAVFQKTISRRSEKLRNIKFISFGIGFICPRGNEQILNNKPVVFLAPFHPRFLDRLVLPPELFKSTSLQFLDRFRDETIYYFEKGDIASSIKIPEDLKAWSPFSGLPLPHSDCRRVLEDCERLIDALDVKDATDCMQEKNFKTSQERKSSKKRKPVRKKKSAVLFGYGNYAKTTILPIIKQKLDLQTIHEVDPLQIPLKKISAYNWKTNPFPNHEENFDAYFVAGFHHTHAPVALYALKQGSYAVVEKPLVTTWEQLAELKKVVKRMPNKLFACFQKRYSPMNELAMEDLEVDSSADPFSYHCIVYEVPLPKMHWYRWPNSKSRLVSNGCHWLDHFLYLNQYVAIHQYDVFVSNDGTINCSVELDNGSYFTMVLTDKGSPRVGVQDYIELRRNDVTVKMVNSSRYQSENSIKCLRKRKVNKRKSYQLMYEKIVSKINEDQAGDSTRSIVVGSELILKLDDKLNSR